VLERTLRRVPGRRRRRDESGLRIALSPASWGVSDVPGWGHQLEPERVLSEVWSLGISAIEAGPPGFLPDRSDQAKLLLRRHWLRVVSGQAHAVLHHHDIRGSELAHIDGHASWLAAVGAETLVLTAIAPRGAKTAHGIVLDSAGWAHLLHLIGSVEHVCARHRLRLAVLPRFGSMIQGPSDIERLMVGTEAGLCFDPGHLLMVGADPLEVLELAEGRIRHVRLNDVDANLAVQVRDGGIDYSQAVAEGLFKAMGTGDARVEGVIETLRKSGYRGWYAIDQDVRLTGTDEKPISSVKRSLDYVRRQAAA
jgi:inosose dehydratase